MPSNPRGRRSSEEWSRSDETCAEIVEGLRPNQRLRSTDCATEGPACEMPAGRQLLNAAWTPPQGFVGWDGAAAKGADRAAHIHTLDAKGGHGAGHTFAFPGAPGGVAGKSFKAPSFKSPVRARRLAKCLV
jgi:hypothetical protein